MSPQYHLSPRDFNERVGTWALNLIRLWGSFWWGGMVFAGYGRSIRRMHENTAARDAARARGRRWCSLRSSFSVSAGGALRSRNEWCESFSRRPLALGTFRIVWLRQWSTRFGLPSYARGWRWCPESRVVLLGAVYRSTLARGIRETQEVPTLYRA